MIKMEPSFPIFFTQLFKVVVVAMHVYGSEMLLLHLNVPKKLALITQVNIAIHTVAAILIVFLTVPFEVILHNWHALRVKAYIVRWGDVPNLTLYRHTAEDDG